MTLGNNLLRIREEHGLIQQEFGQLVHVTRQTVSNWENGKSYPDLQSLIIISDRYGVSLDIPSVYRYRIPSSLWISEAVPFFSRSPLQR